jgi:acyl-coenzyme A thioesterase PaaI-like protein
MHAPDPEPPFAPDEAGFLRLAEVKPVADVRSFVSGDPTGDRLRVAYWYCAQRGELRARAWFGPGAEGPPGHAHGGAIAAVLDELMGVCAWQLGHRVLAARLDVTFVAPLPLGTDAVASARVTAVEGRRITVEGHIGQYAKATGLFIAVRPEMFEAWEKSLA